MRRLLEEFGEHELGEIINVPAQMSPMKMVGLMRPSTIFEEATRYNVSGTSSLASSQSFKTANEKAETSFATATEQNCDLRQSTGSNEFTRDSLCPMTSVENEDIDHDSLNDSVILINDDDAVNTEITLNETLEVVEYVQDENSKYILKPARKSDVNNQNEDISSPILDKSIEVIEIDSSPDSSYITALTNIKTRNSSLFGIAELYSNKKKKSIFDDESWATQSANKSLVSEDSDPIGVDHPGSVTTSATNDSVTSCSPEKGRMANTLDDISSLANDTLDSGTSENPKYVSVENDYLTRQSYESGNDYEEKNNISNVPDVFNDTLERMEYMMEQGRRILEKEKKVTKLPAEKTPIRMLEGRRTPDVLKERNTNSPKTVDAIFKKPSLFNSITPGVIRKPPIHHSASRIPKPKSATKLNGFEHIKSPISIYIKNSAPNTLVRNVKTRNDFFDSSYVNRAVNALDFTLPTDVAPKSTTLPKKAYICTDNLHVSKLF